MAIEHIDPYPWFLNKPLDLVVNEQMVRARFPASEWADSWRPFLARLFDLWVAQYPKRYLIAIAGPPGAGKSVFAEQLHFIIDKGIFHPDAHVVNLPMDGFHYPNAVLQTHTRKLADGTEIPLMSVKGQPDTIDVVRFRKSVQALRARREEISWPGYSRFLHDVVPDKFRVHESANLVIIEGNYLLLNRGPFQGLPDMFNLRIYVDAPAPKIIAALVDRHIRGGKTLDEAKTWVKRVDLPNARLVETTRVDADVIIERDTDDDIASVTWKGEETIPSSKPSLPDSGPQSPHGSARVLPGSHGSTISAYLPEALQKPKPPQPPPPPNPPHPPHPPHVPPKAP